MDKAEKDFSQKLKGFDKVWRRVQQAKQGKAPQSRPGPKPRQKPQSRARRFEPGGF